MDEFTESGIHKPTAEAFYFMLLMWTNVSNDDIDKIMSIVDEQGPMR